MTHSFIKSARIINITARFARFREVCFRRRVEFGSAKYHNAVGNDLAKPRKPRNVENGVPGLTIVGAHAHD